MKSAFTIRLMKKEEKRAVKKIMRRSFPFLARLFFSITPHTFVAEREKELIGGIVLSLFPLKEGRGGLIGWIFALPTARNHGVASTLLEHALDFFEKEGVYRAFACIEGYNTSSSNLFQGKGFSYLSIVDQLKTFGFSTPLIWFHCQHFLDIGHFLWSKPLKKDSEEKIEETQERSIGLWGSVFLVNSLLLLLSLWRIGSLQREHFYLAPLSILLFLFIRDMSMAIAGRAQGLDLRYRAWESGLTLGALIAILFGGFFFAPGSRYPIKREWRYKDCLPSLGYMGMAGALSVILLTLLLSLLKSSSLLSPKLKELILLPISIGKHLSLIDTLFVFFPLSSFNGRRVLDFNVFLWILLAFLSLITFLL